ncbi:multiple sugar transport system substrate-binding protein [Arthrobacter sp. CAN_A214]|uniref:ABC transporter substrate-binding protein n=1 Tax=Arthrobacter sp. CAN_A214 TaxID=2787720 RepID=UPI0018C9CBFA
MKNVSRSVRMGTAASLAVVLGLTLSACGSSSGEQAASSGDGNLRWSWWGSDPRHQANQKIIEQYQTANPDVTISGEYADFSGYWDKLATTTAGRDAPDVITMDEKYLQEYAGRGALADLKELPNLDLSKFDEPSLALGEYEDGLYGLSTGRNAFTVVINEDLFAKAGVPVPDTTTWTWDDYYRISKEVSDKLGLPGSDYGNAPDASLRIWLRQHGESLYNEEEGTVGFTEETAASHFEHLLKIRDEAGGASAAQWTEDQSGTFEGQSFPNNEIAMSWYWSNQLGVLRETSGSNITMHQAPSDSGEAADNGMYFKASMYWSVSSQSDDQEAAADLVNYLANNEEAAKVMLVDRGVPVNPDMAAAVKPELEESDQTVVEFLDDIEEDVAASPKPSPVGTAGVQDVIIRYNSEVLFGNLTPEEAASQMLDEIDGMIQ